MVFWNEMYPPANKATSRGAPPAPPQRHPCPPHAPARHFTSPASSARLESDPPPRQAEQPSLHLSLAAGELTYAWQPD